jgi:hypothetical protein
MTKQSQIPAEIVPGQTELRNDFMDEPGEMPAWVFSGPPQPFAAFPPGGNPAKPGKCGSGVHAPVLPAPSGVALRGRPGQIGLPGSSAPARGNRVGHVLCREAERTAQSTGS